MDVGELGVVTAELMETLEEEFSEYDEVTVGVVAVIAEVNFFTDGEEETAIAFRCSDGRRWIQIGLFNAAIRATELGTEKSEEED